ncbi:MAG: hypothetical protein K2M34_00650 [Alphaproteobacteria bacterium]|nr:hypothetical protein [Alphaproteobacteria bacterium]
MKISYKVLFAAVLAIAGTNAFAADVSGLATTNYVKGAIDSLPDVARTGSYNDLADKPSIPAAQVNADWNATSGKAQILNKPTLGALAAKAAVTSADITDGTIVNADIAANAAIATSKISGLDTALAGKQATANIVNPVDGKFAAGDETSETKYPSMKAAQQIAAAAASNAVTKISLDLTALQGEVSDLADEVDANKASLGDLAAKDTVATADINDGAVTGKKIANGAIVGGGNVSVSQNATTGVITVSGTQYSLPSANGTTLGGVKTGGDITATNGDLTITDGKVTAAKLASNSVTNAKIADDAVTTAKIKGYGTGECSGTNCALVDLGSGAVWLPIVDEYTAK